MLGFSCPYWPVYVYLSSVRDIINGPLVVLNVQLFSVTFVGGAREDTGGRITPGSLEQV